MGISRKLHNLFHPKQGEIWMLHRVVEHRSEEPRQRALEVTPRFLEQKIQEYKQKGYTFVSIDSLPSLLTNHTTQWVCLTFDDGYRDNYTLAYPLLKRLGVPFAIYVTTGFIDNRRAIPWYPDMTLGISTAELKTLDADPLCTIGAHTVGHPRLDTLAPDEQRNEIEQSRHKLEALLGHHINHFSYPHGAYNADTIGICRTLGFLSAVTTSGRPVRTDSRPLELDRINIIQP